MLRFHRLLTRKLSKTPIYLGDIAKNADMGDFAPGRTEENILAKLAKEAKKESFENKPRVYTTKEEDANGNESIAVLHMNYSEKMNSLDVQFLTDIETVLNQINPKNSSCLIIKSDVPHVFNLGLDLKEREHLKQRQVGPFVARIRSLINTIRNAKMPTIAAIDGYCLGTGMELALACDFRIATNHSQLQLSDIEMMLNGGVGTLPSLYQMCGEAGTKKILFGTGNYSGDDALELRLINECLKPRKNEAQGSSDLIYDFTVEYARKLIDNSKMETNALHKACVNEGLWPFDKSDEKIEKEWLRQWKEE